MGKVVGCIEDDATTFILIQQRFNVLLILQSFSRYRKLFMLTNLLVIEDKFVYFNALLRIYLL